MYLYADILKRPEVVSELTKHGLNDIDSPLGSMMEENGNHIFNFPESHLPEIVSMVLKGEIIARQSAKKQKAMAEEYEARPEGRLKKKAQQIRPFIEKHVAGKLRQPYDNLENGLVNLLSELAAKKYDFDSSGESTQEDFTGLSNLERLLKESSITRLSGKMSMDEIALRVCSYGPYAGWLK